MRSEQSKARQERGGTSRRSGGFTLLELLVTVAIIGIVSAIAVPNLQEALQRSRRMAAYASARQVATGIEHYMVEFDDAPATLAPATLEPLVSTGMLSARQAPAILRTFENDTFQWYLSLPWLLASDGGYFYIMAFRPKGEPDPLATCYLWDDTLWRWDQESGWHQPIQ